MGNINILDYIPYPTKVTGICVVPDCKRPRVELGKQAHGSYLYSSHCKEHKEEYRNAQLKCLEEFKKSRIKN